MTHSNTHAERLIARDLRAQGFRTRTIHYTDDHGSNHVTVATAHHGRHRLDVILPTERKLCVALVVTRLAPGKPVLDLGSVADRAEVVDTARGWRDWLRTLTAHPAAVPADGDDLDDAFGPLDDLSRADVGAIEIQYQEPDGSWDTL